MLKPIIFLLIILIPIFLKAQEIQPVIAQQFYEIHTYTTKDGLSQVSVNDIIQDNEGFLWIATQSGLNRFDGTSFRTFENADYSQENCGNYINVLLPDNNIIWIGSRAKGLCYFSKKMHRFFGIEAWQDFNIEDMAMDSLHHLYFTVENKGIGFLKVDNEKYQANLIPYFNDKSITATTVFITGKGTLWNQGRQAVLW